MVVENAYRSIYIAIFTALWNSTCRLLALLTATKSATALTIRHLALDRFLLKNTSLNL